MTRKHFVALADAIANLSDKPSKAEIISAIAGVCRQFNSNFDWGRFAEACRK
jgi:hypothetical protein